MTTYFMLDELAGAVKIGQSDNPTARRRQLQTGNPRRLRSLLLLPLGLEHLGGCKPGDWDEATLHQRFAASRISGEWFRYTDDIQEFVSAMIAEGA